MTRAAALVALVFLVAWGDVASAQVRLGQPAGCVLQGRPRPVSCGPGFGLLGASAVAVSPDATQLYAAAATSYGVATLARDGAGTLRWTGCVSDDGSDGTFGGDGRCLDGDALRGPSDIDVSPDGRFVYVTDPRASAVSVLARDPAGTLRPSSCVALALPDSRCGRAFALRAPRALVLSPDARFAYVVSSTSSSIAVFARDATSGALSQTGCISDNGNDGVCADGIALRGATALALSPDGAYLYAAARSSGAIAVLARDPATGALRQTGCLLRNAPAPGRCAKADALAGVAALAISGDGGTLWAGGSATLSAFTRDAATGELTAAACLGGEGCTAVTRFGRATSLLAGPDGTRVLVGDSTSGTVLPVTRGPAGLVEGTCLRGRNSYGIGQCTPSSGLDSPGGFVAAPDHRLIYAATDRGVVTLAPEGPW